MKLQNDKCNIEICVDETYILDSANNRPYDIVINPFQRKRNDFYKVFSIRIDLFHKQLNIALVGDFFSYESNCAILEDEILTVLQNDIIIQISIIDGSVLLLKTIDGFGCNFGIYKTPYGYLIYGETSITMLDFSFEEKWQFSGTDIFVSISGKTAFQICEKSIKLYDFNDNFYEIDFDGKLISKDQHFCKPKVVRERALQDRNRLLDNMDKIHTTEMGIGRIKKNLKINAADVVGFCKKLIINDACNIYKQGKNYYCEVNSIRLTINTHSFTIITAHRM